MSDKMNVKATESGSSPYFAQATLTVGLIFFMISLAGSVIAPIFQHHLNDGIYTVSAYMLAGVVIIMSIISIIALAHKLFQPNRPIWKHVYLFTVITVLISAVGFILDAIYESFHGDLQLSAMLFLLFLFGLLISVGLYLQYEYKKGWMS